MKKKVRMTIIKKTDNNKCGGGGRGGKGEGNFIYG
jgi:hypothetical protein